MATKKRNWKELMEEVIKTLLPKLSEEQKERLRAHPELVLDISYEVCKQECEKCGVDYTTTPMYETELQYRKTKEQIEVSREKWAHLDTPQGIELYEMALRVASKKKMLSLPTERIIYNDGTFRRPAAFKALMEVGVLSGKPDSTLSKKMREELIRFNEFYDQNYSLDMFVQLSRKEQLLLYARHIIGNLTNEQLQFVSQFIDEHDHLPMFYLITAFYENTDLKSCIAARDYHGLCGRERKSLEQIQSELGLSRHRVQELIRRGFPFGSYRTHIPRSCWEPYRSLFTAPLLRADNCHYERIKEEEHLFMDVNDFMKLIIIHLKNIRMVQSLKRGDDRLWGVSDNVLGIFRLWTFIDAIREEQIRKDRPKAVTFDLKRICKGKKYLRKDTEMTSEESEMIISVIKPILKEMLGIEAKGNKIIFPAKRK